MDKQSIHGTDIETVVNITVSKRTREKLYFLFFSLYFSETLYIRASVVID